MQGEVAIPSRPPLGPFETPPRDEDWLGVALEQARLCFQSAHNPAANLPQDVPVGAICVFENRLISAGYNCRERDQDPVAHAEILALRAAAVALGRRDLSGVTLFVTLEPCPMCAGGLWLARIDRLVFGAWDDKAGACGSVFDLPRDPRLNHRMQVKGGVREAECAALLREFFAHRRGARPGP